MIVKERHDIGGGAHWKVERWYLESPIEQFGTFHDSIIVKKKIKGEFDSNQRTYQRIKEAGLPTLTFFKTEVFEGESLIIGEDLNNGKVVYLSPNSGRQIPPKSCK
jgi:hypothetical protein